MGERKEFICINCPLSCSVTVLLKYDELSVSGNECKRGEEYALQEYRNPQRILTGTVSIEGALLPRLPVKTDASIPKELIPQAAAALSRIVVKAPIHCGAVIEPNIVGSGVNLIATRDLGVIS